MLDSRSPSRYQSLNPEHIQALMSIVGKERVTTNAADLVLHSRDQSFHESHSPEVVVYPSSAEEVSTILRLANAAHIPITAWGAGSSLEGNPIPVYGGILLDFQHMASIIAVHANDFQVDVQPGLTRLELNKQVAKHGLFFAPDPGANATIGGMVANNSSGVKTIKYGATKDNVMCLEVVTADGTIHHVGSRARKNSSGYDLLHLFIGSEGTLGIVTRATLKLYPIPANFSAVLAAFSSIADAMQTVVDIMGAGLEPSALEFIDVETIRAIKKDKGLTLTESPTIIMEFNGSSDDQGLAEAIEICKLNNASNFQSARGLEERNRLWEARHHTYESLLRLHPNEAQLIMDCCVPLSQYPALTLFAADVLAEEGVLGYKFGHAGDGNLHINLMYTTNIPESLERVRRVNTIIVERAIALGGTATGEHGVGIGKRKFMEQQHGPTLELMRSVKQLFDPNGILNPGKIFQ